jgi:hypothetical protein
VIVPSGASSNRKEGGKIVWHAPVDDDRDHWPVGMPPSKEPHLLVYSNPTGRERGAQYDQCGGRIERCNGGVGQRTTAGKILAVPKNRSQCLGHRAERRRAPDQVLVDVKAFKRAVEPLRPAHIAVAVAQKRAVLQ